MATNRLFYGDNLPVLREHIETESVDLVYLDPPFNSNRWGRVKSSGLGRLPMAHAPGGVQDCSQVSC